MSFLIVSESKEKGVLNDMCTKSFLFVCLFSSFNLFPFLPPIHFAFSSSLYSVCVPFDVSIPFNPRKKERKKKKSEQEEEQENQVSVILSSKVLISL